LLKGLGEEGHELLVDVGSDVEGIGLDGLVEARFFG